MAGWVLSRGLPQCPVLLVLGLHSFHPRAWHLVGTPGPLSKESHKTCQKMAIKSFLEGSSVAADLGWGEAASICGCLNAFACAPELSLPACACSPGTVFVHTGAQESSILVTGSLWAEYVPLMKVLRQHYQEIRWALQNHIITLPSFAWWIQIPSSQSHEWSS